MRLSGKSTSSWRALSLAVCCAVVVSLSAAIAQSAVLSPGQNALSVGDPAPTGGGIIAGPLASNFNAGSFTGTLTSTVISDPANPHLGLTFIYVLTNDVTSVDDIHRLTINDYAGFLTDVTYQTPAAGLPHSFNDRSAGLGNVMGFTFSDPIPANAIPGNGVLAPGMTSATMVIRTNAASWIFTTAAVIDGTSQDSVQTYAPDIIVPEPSTLGLAGLALIGWGLYLRRRWAQR